MAQVKISELTEANLPLDGTEDLPVVQDGVTVRCSTQDIADLATGEVTTVKVSLTSAEILDLNSTPKQLIAAPGANKFILPLRVIVKGNFGTQAYATNTNLQFAPNTLFQTNFSAALGFTQNQLATYTLTTAAGTTTLENTVNAAINIFALSGNPTTGDGTVDIYVTYTTVTL